MDFNIFGSAPEYYSGLLGQDATDKLQKRATGTGIANALLALVAQPRNQGYNSALPYIGRALMAGQQAGQNVIESGFGDFERTQKIADIKRQQDQRKAFDEASKNLYTTTPAKFETVTSAGGYAPVQSEMQEGQVAPKFGMNKLPDVTSQREIAPSSQTLNQQALQQMMLSGDPRAASYLSGLKTVKELTTPEEIESPFAKLNPKDFTTESIKIFNKTGNYADLLAATETPKMTEEPTRVAYAMYGKPINQLTQQEVGEVNRYIEQSKVRVAGASVPSQSPGFKDAGELRKEFNALPEIKAFKEVQIAFDQIMTGLTSDSPAGDITAATKFMKLLDPGSVVRESELAIAMGATGLWDRATNYFDMMKRGTKLTPAQRLDFKNVAQELYNAARNTKQQTESFYSNIANQGGLNPNLVIGNPSSESNLNSRISNELNKRKK